MENGIIASQEKRYLVRKLTVIKGENCKVFSLYYVDVNEDWIEIRPFDRERAGYIYLECLSLKENGQGKLEIGEWASGIDEKPTLLKS